MFSGLIRSNISARIALKVLKAAESNIILDEGGVGLLMSAGDMLVKLPGDPPLRSHGPLILREDIDSVVVKLA